MVILIAMDGVNDRQRELALRDIYNACQTLTGVIAQMSTHLRTQTCF